MYKLVFIYLFAVLIILKNKKMNYTILIKESFCTFYVCYKDCKGIETIESINDFQSKNNEIQFIFCDNLKSAKKLIKTI